MSETISPHLVFLNRVYVDVIEASGLSVPVKNEGNGISNTSFADAEVELFASYFRHANRQTGYLADCYDQYREVYDKRLNPKTPDGAKGKDLWLMAAIGYGQKALANEEPESSGLLLQAVRRFIVLREKEGFFLAVCCSHLTDAGIIEVSLDPKLKWQSPDDRTHPCARYGLSEPEGGDGRGSRRRRRSPRPTTPIIAPFRPAMLPE